MGPDEPVEDRPTFEAIRRLIRGMLPSALFKERWSETPYTDTKVPTYNAASGKFEPGTPSGTGAPTNAQYLTLATDATLSVERVFTPGTALSAVDSGAGAAYTLNHAVVASGDLHSEYVLESAHASPSYDAGHHARSHDLESGSDHTTSSGVDGHFMRQTGATSYTFEADYYMVTFLLSSTSALTTGIYADIMIPSAGVLEEWNLLLDAADTMTVTCTFCTYAGYDTFGAFTPALAPATAAVIKATSGALTTAVAAKDIIRFNLSAAGGVAKRLSLNLWIRKS